MEVSDIDRETLAAIFAARVSLAKKSLADALAEAQKEYLRTILWIDNNSQKEGSFRWFCVEFDLDPGIVRKAVEKARAG